MQTADPVTAFIINISDSFIPSNDTSIERCSAKMETNASAKDIFLSVTILAEILRRDFMKFTVARVVFVKVYVAIAIITIIWNSCPLSRTTDRITVPASGTDKLINIIPVNFDSNRRIFLA